MPQLTIESPMMAGQGGPHVSRFPKSPNHVVTCAQPPIASFSPRSSLRDSGASFPIVEDVNEEDEDSDSVDEDRRSIHQNKIQMEQRTSIRSLEQLERQQEDRAVPGSYQRVIRPTYIPDSESPFANLGKKSSDKALRSTFMPTVLTPDQLEKYPSYVCPRCKTRQRAFFTISDAPRAHSEPSNYLAFYFGIYVIASLFIYGLEEGWKPLDWYVIQMCAEVIVQRVSYAIVYLLPAVSILL